jgi:hypothetical protein
MLPELDPRRAARYQIHSDYKKRTEKQLQRVAGG